MAFPSLDRNVHVHERIFRQVCTANAIPTRIAISLILTLHYSKFTFGLTRTWEMELGISCPKHGRAVSKYSK